MIEQPGAATEFATLRELLVGPERQQLDELPGVEYSCEL
jgi:hypothetical protein